MSSGSLTALFTCLRKWQAPSFGSYSPPFYGYGQGLNIGGNINLLHRVWAPGLCTTHETVAPALDIHPYRGTLQLACSQASTLIIAHRCRQTLTVEALGWTEFSLCCVTLAATILWMRSGLGKKKFIRDSRTFV